MSTWLGIDHDGLLAHEAGHNFGASHASSGIMSSSSASGFASVSKNEMNAFVAAKGTCFGTELSDGSVVTCPPASDDANWAGYFGRGIYDCAWLANQSNAAGFCAAYSIFQTYCQATCDVGC